MALELTAGLAATEEDRLLQAEAAVRSYCGWHIAPSRTEELTLDAQWSSVLMVPSLYVTDVSAVTDDGTLADVTGYTWRQNGTIELHSGYWTNRKVVVALTHGYDEVPLEVEGVVRAVAQRTLDNPGSVVREQAGPFNVTHAQTGFNQVVPGALLDAEKAILDRYKIPPRP